MRSILFIAMVIYSLGVNAQKIAPTTEDEYNIGLAGYKMFLQMKVPIREGYKIVPFETIEYGDRKAEFRGVVRNGEKSPCAMIIVYTKLRGAPEYYCVPTPDAPEALWDNYRVAIGGNIDNKQEQLEFFCFALAKSMMYFAGE